MFLTTAQYHAHLGQFFFYATPLLLSYIEKLSIWLAMNL